jgi:hypothetical protein
MPNEKQNNEYIEQLDNRINKFRGNFSGVVTDLTNALLEQSIEYSVKKYSETETNKSIFIYEDKRS